MPRGGSLLEVGERLVLQLPAVKNWPRLERELQRMLEVRPKAEAGEVILDVGTQVLSADQLVQIEGMLREHGLNLMRVVHGPEGQDASEVPFSAKEEREEGHREGKRRLRSGKAGLPAPRVEAETDSQVEEPGEPTLVRRGPVRCGQAIRFPGHVVILGDVNPGAEIVAAGDVIVLGTLRGVAHAGAGGRRQAVVAALRLCPTQLRISDCIGRAPDEDSVRERGAELARVNGSEIVVEAL